MTHTVAVAYSPSIMLAGVRRFWWRHAGRDALLGLAGVVAALVIWLACGVEHWSVFLLLGVFGLLLSVSVGVYFAFRVRSLHRLRLMEQPSATWSFDEAGFSAESSLGQSRVPWSAIREVWRFPDVWILCFSRYDHSILPASDLSPEVLEFIASRVQSHGGIVA
jgi:hypothetical protein